MVRKGWKNVALPEEIVETIDRVVDSGKHGFRSRSSFVLTAVRNELRNLGFYP